MVLLLSNFRELFEDNALPDKVWDKIFNINPDDGIKEFINLIMSGVHGVFDIFSMCITFFFNVPVLALLLSFGMAFAGFRVLKYALVVSQHI